MRETTNELVIRVLAWLAVLVPAAAIAAVLGFALWMRSFSALGPVGATVFGLSLAVWAALLVWRSRREQ